MNMKKTQTAKPQKNHSDDLRPHYDFDYTKAKPNRFAKARNGKARVSRQRHKVTIHKSDGTSEVRYVRSDEDAVILEPDVRKYFPNSAAVNKALRGLIALAPRKRS